MCALHNTGISSLNTHSPLSKSSKMFYKPFHTNCKEQAKKKSIYLHKKFSCFSSTYERTKHQTT